MRRILLEAFLVAAVGAIIGFTANALSPRGLNLARDYFALPTNSTVAPFLHTNTVITPRATNSSTEEQELVARLAQEGLQSISGDQVATLFHDSRYQDGRIIFVDARNDHAYQKGHIPGAYQFDYFRFEQYLAAVLPACQTAEQIIIYCNGGKCTDSEHASLMLRDDGKVPASKIFIYTGGISDWTNRHNQVESGARNSGAMGESK